jgi:uncharacterized protein (TIGR00725 family)
LTSNAATYIAVIGPGTPQPEAERIAHEVGTLLGRAGVVLVCGGLGGAMEAACRGAKVAGGTTVGILPDNDRGDANPHVDIAIPTGMGEARNALVVRAADVVIAIGGGFGTLSEIGLALKVGKPLIGLRTWDVARESEPIGEIIRAASAEEAVKLALELSKRHEG